ncbi:cellulose biosynthesis protein BcsS [Afipia sp. TerB]
MRCVRVLRVFCAAALLLSCGAGNSVANPLQSIFDLTGSLKGGAQPERFLYFSGFDLWREGTSSYGGMQWAPAGLNNDGFTLKLLLAGGQYRYTAGMMEITGTNFLVAALPGWRIKRGNFEAKLFAGLDLQHHVLSPDDPTNGLRGTHAGLRVGADLWWEPTHTLMIASSLSGSTIGINFGARLATGWRLFDRCWFGPEIETMGDEIYRQYRAGVHITSLKYGRFEWAFGAGYSQDSDHRAGLYGRFSLLTRR